MNTFVAVMIAEGVRDVDEDTQIEAWQHLIDTGIVWKLQGRFGRHAERLIDTGLCRSAST